MAIIINLIYSGQRAQWITRIFNPAASTLMTIALVTKVGLSPFHFWLPEVTRGIPWTADLMLSTWQNCTPISFIPQVTFHQPKYTINHSDIINHSWRLRQTSPYSPGKYYTLLINCPYRMNNSYYNVYSDYNNPNHTNLYHNNTVFFLFMPRSCTTRVSLSHTWDKTPPITIIFLTIIVSLGHRPSLSGFLPKWIIIQEITKTTTSFYQH